MIHIQHHEQLPWFGYALATFLSLGVCATVALALWALAGRRRPR